MLPVAIKPRITAVATPVEARPAAATVTRLVVPDRRNSLRRRARKSGGSVARRAARLL